jgi:hypothetical protein
MFYGDLETKNKETLKRIENYRAAAALTPIIIKIVNQFDGKVFNCKLDKAIREATGNKAGVYKRDNHVEIYTYYSTSYYHITYATFRVDQDNKRIDAAALVEQIRKAREDNLKKAYDLETTYTQAESIHAYIRSAIDKLESYCKSLPDDLRDIYNIPTYIRTS